MQCILICASLAEVLSSAKKLSADWQTLVSPNLKSFIGGKSCRTMFSLWQQNFPAKRHMRLKFSVQMVAIQGIDRPFPAAYPKASANARVS